MPDDVGVETKSFKFWNKVLVPKFIAFKYALMGGLTRHSVMVLSTLLAKEDNRIVMHSLSWVISATTPAQAV